MPSTSSYGEYHTKVFYISLCLNGRGGHSNILISLQKGQSKAMEKNRPSQQQQCKGMANFSYLQINLSLFYFSFRYLCINQKPKTLCTNQFYAPLPLVRSL